MGNGVSVCSTFFRSLLLYCLLLAARLDPIDPVPSFDNVPLAWSWGPAPAIFACAGLLTLCNATSTWRTEAINISVPFYFHYFLFSLPSLP
jgi:hypothetical protein